MQSRSGDELKTANCFDTRRLIPHLPVKYSHILLPYAKGWPKPSPNFSSWPYFRPVKPRINTMCSDNNIVPPVSFSPCNAVGHQVALSLWPDMGRPLAVGPAKAKLEMAVYKVPCPSRPRSCPMYTRTCTSGSPGITEWRISPLMSPPAYASSNSDSSSAKCS